MALIQRGFYPISKIYIFNQLDFLRNSPLTFAKASVREDGRFHAEIIAEPLCFIMTKN